jgi:hypothetical protein
MLTRERAYPRTGWHYGSMAGKTQEDRVHSKQDHQPIHPSHYDSVILPVYEGQARGYDATAPLRVNDLSTATVPL